MVPPTRERRPLEPGCHPRSFGQPGYRLGSMCRSVSAGVRAGTGKLDGMERSTAIKTAVDQASEVFGTEVDVEGVRYDFDKWLITVGFQRTEMVDMHLNHLFGLPPQPTERLARVYKVVEVPDWPELEEREDDREYVIRNLDG